MSPINNSGLGHRSHASDEQFVSPVFDLFNKPANESGVKTSRAQKFFPTTSLTNEGPFEFRITTSDSEFLFAPLTRLGGSIKVVRNDGEPLTDTDVVSVVNLPIDSLFQSIVVELNNVKLEDTSYCYHYKSFLEKTLSYGDVAKNSHMKNDIFFMDEPGKFDIITKEGNSGFRQRAERFSLSKDVHFQIPLSLDLSTISRPLPNNSTYVIRLSRSPDSFVLLAKEDQFRIKIIDLYLEVMKITPSDTMLGQISRRFNSEPLIYPITRSKIKRYTIPAGVFDGSQHGLFESTPLPRFILIGLVDQQSYSGQISKNPYFFQNFSISEIALSHNNYLIPASPYRPDWDVGKYFREYRAFFDNLGIYHTNDSNSITPELFHSGLTLFPFDLSPDQCNGFHRHSGGDGEISLQLRFKKATEKGITLIVYSVFETTFSVSKTAGVITNYTL